MASFQWDKIATVVLIISLFVGLMNYLTSFQSNHCDMTYMFENPQYIPVKLPASAKNRFPRYSLFVYGEGYYAEQLRNEKYSGIPVLFIPGNAGSYKQVRSLGSVSYQKSTGSLATFNYFAVDLNEEYSGLFGGTLKDQTDFVHFVVKHILNLYNAAVPKVSSIILVGHSMGGVIARALFSLPDFDPKSVNVIFTQASPHQSLAYFDRHMLDFYKQISSSWKENRNKSIKHVNLVSVGGGHRDVLVRSALTSLPYEEQHLYDIQTLTTAIPDAWLSNDHLSIVWCKQLVMVTVRAMFEMYDPVKKKIMPNSMKRADVLHYNFIRKPSKLSYPVYTKYDQSLDLNPNAVWKIYRKSSWFYIQSKIISLIYLTIPIRRDGYLVAIAKHVPTVNWFFTCKAVSDGPQQLCLKGNAISDQFQLPTRDKAERRVVMINLDDWRSATHAAIQVEPSTAEVEVQAEVFKPADRCINFEIPWMPLAMMFQYPVVDTLKSAVFYNITLDGFRQLWHAYKVSIKSTGKSCTRDNVAVLRFHVPWNTEDIYFNLSPKKLTQLVIKLQSAPPVNLNVNPELHFYLDPQCMYSISISASISDTMGQIIRYFTFIFPTLMIAILCEALSFQFASYKKFGKCPPLIESISTIRGVYTVVLPTYLILYITRHEKVYNYFDFLPTLTDYSFETRTIHYSSFLIFLYVLLVAFVKMLAILINVPFRAIGYVFCFILYRRQNKEPGALSERSNIILPLPSIISAALVSCVYSMCGGIILIIGLLFYFIKVGYLQGKLKQAENRGRDISIMSRSANTHYTLCLLWWLTCLLTAPSLITWVKTLNYDLRLNPDPSLFPAIVLIVCLGFLWDDEGIMLHSTLCSICSWLLHLVSVMVLCFGLDVLYYCVYFICVIFMLNCLVTLLSVKFVGRDRQL